MSKFPAHSLKNNATIEFRVLHHFYKNLSTILKHFDICLILLLVAVWIGVDISGHVVAVYGGWVEVQKSKY